MMHMQILILAIAAFMMISINASCPNKCSGHGSCGANDVCSCDEKFIGGDCSQRQCPYTRAWVDTAQNADDAHWYAECANRGTCDRDTGMCVCDAGFGGSGCRRMECPNFCSGQGAVCPTSCSGHGSCEFIEEIAVDDEDKRIAGTVGNTYTDWDQEKIMGCKCDAGYEGHDCASRMCPHGDDPLTGSSGDQYDMQQYISIIGITDTMFLTYYDPYGNAWTTDEIDSAVDSFTADQDAVCANIQTALRQLPNHALDLVTVAAADTNLFTFTRTAGADAVTSGAGVTTTYGTADGAALRCIVTFPSSPGTTGLQHNLGCQVGGQATEGMQPILSSSIGTTCDVAESVPTTGTTVRKLTEIVECSNRGICDITTGACACFAGHKGAACETQEALV